MCLLYDSALEQLSRHKAKSLIATFLAKNDSRHKDQKLEYLDMDTNNAQTKPTNKQAASEESEEEQTEE